jgi:hypothetical protein
LQQRGGLLLSAIAAAIAGGIAPEIAKAIAPPKSLASQRTKYRLNVGDVAFAIGVFAINGIITDLQYRLFNRAIGTDNTFSTALKKMLTDQFLTTPIYGAVYWALVFRWKTHHFRIIPLLREVGPRWYAVYVGRLLVPSWCFWIPMPRTLQFSLFCLVLAAWSLLMVFVASDS